MSTVMAYKILATVELLQSGPQLRTALEQMLRRPGKPFVIVEAEPHGNGPFVQFCGSAQEPLKIDCPPLKIVATPIRIEYAATEAQRMLREQGVEANAVLRILEGE